MQNGEKNQTEAAPLISVAIYLKGSALDPALVSSVIGVEPSRSQRKGGLRAGSTKFIAKIGMWALKVKSESRSMPELIDELLQRSVNQRRR
jgi:hypothetical protein